MKKTKTIPQIKYHLYLLLTSAALLCAFVLSAGAAQAHHPGDVSGDGAVTAEDARLCLRQAVGLEAFAAESAEYRACEVDGDPGVAASDARLILRAAVGLEELPAHVFGPWTPQTDNTGALTGRHTRACAACKETETGDCAYGEKVYVSENKAPTCTAGCAYTETCAVCGGVKTTKEEAAGHSFDAWTPQTDNTGALTGKHTRACAACKETETGDCAYGEKVYVSENKAPTCTAGCAYTETCAVCGGVKTTKEEAAGHSFGAWTPETDNTGALTGRHTRACAVCKATETGDCAYGEKVYTTENKAPTCTAACAYTETCAVCGGVKTTKEEAAGHSFGAWKPETDKTGGLTGRHIRVCTVCEKAETGSCTYGERVCISVNQTPTCVVGCTYTATCPVCGGVVFSEEAARGHSYGAWTPETDTNGAPTGRHIRTCAACPAVEAQTCAYGGKVYVSENKTPTCTAGCKYTETCAVCGGVKTTEEQALGHRLVPVENRMVCERCGESFLFTENNEYDMLRGDVFYCSGTMLDGGSRNPMEIAFFANGFYTRASMDGMHCAIQILGSDVYLIAPEKDAYYKTGRASLKALGVDVDDLAGSADFRNLPALAEANAVTEGFLEDESCSVYTFLQADGRMLVYMKGDRLLGMDSYDENWARISSMRFSEVTETLPSHVTRPGGGAGKRVLSLLSFAALFD